MSAAPLKPRHRDDLIAVVVVVVVLVADQLTKNWALSSFSLQPHPVAWTLQLYVTRNTGTAFSLLSGKGVGPVIALIAIVVVVVVVRTLRFVKGRTAVIASGLVVGGALGNLADRLVRTNGAGFLQGAVVDWIDFQWWPVFNIADASITVGAVVLGVTALFSPAEEAPDDAPVP